MWSSHNDMDKIYPKRQDQACPFVCIFKIESRRMGFHEIWYKRHTTEGYSNPILSNLINSVTTLQTH